MPAPLHRSNKHLVIAENTPGDRFAVGPVHSAHSAEGLRAAIETCAFTTIAGTITLLSRAEFIAQTRHQP